MFQLISDCHLELVKDKAILLPRIEPRAPWLVLAGDIGNPYKKNYSMFLETCSKGWDHVFAVAGNHEYYSHSARRLMSEIDEKIRSVCSQFPNVTFLQKDVFYLKDPGDPNKQIAVVGATLWTKMEPETQPLIRQIMNDYRTIFNDRSGTKSYNISPAGIDNLHRDYASWLYDTVKAAEENPLISHIVIVTHHPGSFEILDPQYGGEENVINHAYATNYNRLIESWTKVKLWFSGHTHITKTCMVGQTRLISNCLGYPDKRGSNDGRYDWTALYNIESLRSSIL